MTQKYACSVRVAPYYYEDAGYRAHVEKDAKWRLISGLVDELKEGEVYTIQIHPPELPSRPLFEGYQYGPHSQPEYRQYVTIGIVERHEIRLEEHYPYIAPPPLWWRVKNWLRKKLVRPFTHEQVQKDIANFR